MNRDKFKVPVAEIGSGTVVELKDLNAVELELDKIPVKDISNISGRITLKTTTIGITANFYVSFDAVHECVRCLDHFIKRTVSELMLVYSEGPDPLWERDNTKLKSQDSERIYYRGPFVDLRSGIREAIILAIPITALCAEDCPGLCPVCGNKKGSSFCTCHSKAKGVFSPGGVRHDKPSNRT